MLSSHWPLTLSPFLPLLRGPSLFFLVGIWGVARARIWHIFFFRCASIFSETFLLSTIVHFVLSSKFNSKGKWVSYLISELLTLQFALDEVQGMLPQNTAPEHIEYFKQKEFEKTAKAGRSLWQPPTYQKAEDKSCCESYPPCTRSKADILITTEGNLGLKSVCKQTLLFLHCFYYP